MAEHVRDRKADNRPVFAEITIGQKSAQQWQQITGGLEVRVNLGGLAVLETKHHRQVQRHDRPHAVVRATLGEFTEEDVVEAPRMTIGRRQMGNDWLLTRRGCLWG